MRISDWSSDVCSSDLANFLERRTMSLNVKDPEAHRLAQAIAQATGQSMTRVVPEALRERFARIERQKSKASVAELLTIADRAATHVKRPQFDRSSERPLGTKGFRTGETRGSAGDSKQKKT